MGVPKGVPKGKWGRQKANVARIAHKVDIGVCDNIHSWISTTGDIAFSHQQEFTVLNSQKGFWRSLPEISLF
jgi:hypothetical protein